MVVAGEELMQIATSVFVVTGAGSGIGREVAKELLRRGGRVAGVDVHQAALEETRALAHAGDRISLHVVDVADRAAVERLPQEVIDVHGRVDGLAHIAGIIQPFVTIDELTIEQIEKVMAVNFWGTVYLDKAFIPLLRQRPQASLLNVSSMGALVPVPGQGAYGASKAAVKLLTETLYAELADSTIAVTVVFPGGVRRNIAENSGVDVSKLGAASSAKVTAADVAGRLIVDAIENGTPRLLIGKDAKSLDKLSRVAPTRAITTVANKMKALLG
jgi:NAD(P)-dependent dehydrogenase (short-subunit alcohol dehydrogenase family)